MFLSRTLGALYIINNIESDTILERAKKQVLINSSVFVVFFLYFLIRILVKDGYAYHPDTGLVFMESYKYLNNYLQMPVALIFLISGVTLVIWGIAVTWLKESKKGIWYSGTGTFATVLSIFWILGYNNTAFYPSFDIQSSLTIENASSSHYTLTAMSYISLFVPVVIGYIYYAWRAVDKNKINAEHMKGEGEHHVY